MAGYTHPFTLRCCRFYDLITTKEKYQGDSGGYHNGEENYIFLTRHMDAMVATGFAGEILYKQRSIRYSDHYGWLGGE